MSLFSPQCTVARRSVDVAPLIILRLLPTGRNLMRGAASLHPATGRAADLPKYLYKAYQLTPEIITHFYVPFGVFKEKKMESHTLNLSAARGGEMFCWFLVGNEARLISTLFTTFFEMYYKYNISLTNHDKN